MNNVRSVSFLKIKITADWLGGIIFYIKRGFFPPLPIFLFVKKLSFHFARNISLD